MSVWYDELEADRSSRVEHALSLYPDEASQLDAIAEIRGWYNTHNTANSLINKYLLGDASVAETANQLADPIDRLYTSGDTGQAFHEAEAVARSQRPLCTPAEALEIWGPEVEIPDPASTADANETVEGRLWELWYAVLHASRKTPWTEQRPLVQLVQTLKQRADPPRPRNITKPLLNDWVYGSGKVWSRLLMLGAAARETWNDFPGGGAGFSAPEVQAWINTNGFVAWLCVTETAGFWTYGIWAFRDALEREQKGDGMGRRGTAREIKDVVVPVAAVWVRVAGRAMYRKICEREGDEGVEEEWFDGQEELPDSAHSSNEYTMARWRYWKERFGVMARRETISEATRKVAAETVSFMTEMEQSKRESR